MQPAITRTHTLRLQVRMPLASLPKRKPSHRLNTNTELLSVAYYLARHKTTGARGWMSILCILVLVYTLPTVLQNLSSTTAVPYMTVDVIWHLISRHTADSVSLFFFKNTKHFVMYGCHTPMHIKPVESDL